MDFPEITLGMLIEKAQADAERIEALEQAIKRLATHRGTVSGHSVMLHSHGARDDFDALLALVATTGGEYE